MFAPGSASNKNENTYFNDAPLKKIREAANKKNKIKGLDKSENGRVLAYHTPPTPPQRGEVGGEVGG